MKFDIKQLIVFVEAADHLSFSRAADILGLAQASVSERISNLETSLGVKLFNRLGRQVELTSTGRFLLDRARQIISLREDIVRELKDHLDLRHGEVCLGASTAPGEYMLPSVLGRFAKEFPDINARLAIGDSEAITRKIEAGSLELGIVGSQVNTQTFASQKMWQDELVLIASPAHGLARKRGPISPKTLLNEAWVVRESGSGTRGVADRFLKKHIPGGFRAVNVIAELGSVTAVKQGVKSGLGVSLISGLTVAEELKNKSLVKISLATQPEQRSFYLIREKRRTLSPAAKALWTFILREPDA
ncbi:MAG: selenium metabolism-associated LysR family transcriptional regulator [Myxococcota bacterium]|nr:selenium metabolism-associated LysR family transcriptional regulator [Myxococcota bacterium]